MKNDGQTIPTKHRTTAQPRPNQHPKQNHHTKYTQVQCPHIDPAAAELTSNVVLAAQASAAMVSSRYECAAFATNVADAVMINMGGTASDLGLGDLSLTMLAAREADKPAVLDPDGCGDTPHRTVTCLQALRLGRPLVVRGNAREIVSLAV
jgi:hydroxyethylthiazole kinase